MEEKRLLTAIKETAARFDLFDFPLTDFELWQFLPYEVSYLELRNCLAQLQPLETKGGFYFLAGRSNSISIRQNRYREAKKKIDIAQCRISLISWIPWIRLIALANVIGPQNLKAKSDIDLFIVTKRNRIWLVKLLATSIVALLRLRPTETHSTNQLCLSFLADDGALNLEHCLLGSEDWYFAYWLIGLQPLFGSTEAYFELLRANPWLTRFVPNWQLACPMPRKRFKKHERRAHSFALWNAFETVSKKINYLLMSRTLKKLANNGSGVIISDHLLKLHTLDRRQELFNKALERAQITI